MAITFRPGGAPVTDRPKEGRSALLYGPPFSGKTSTLQYDPTIKVLLMDLDKNSGVLDSVGNVDILGVSTLAEIQKVREGVPQGFVIIPGVGRIELKYDLYVIDSFTTLEEAVKEYVVSSEFAPTRAREIKGRFGAQTDWDDLQRIEVKEFRDWQRLTRSHGVNVLWIGHDMEAKESTDFKKVIHLRLQGKQAAPGVMGATDGVFYMVKHKLRPAKDKPEMMHYGIHTDNLQEGTVTYKAGARMPARERMKFPELIWWPKWGEIFRQLGSTTIPEKVKPDEHKPSTPESTEKSS